MLRIAAIAAAASLAACAAAGATTPAQGLAAQLKVSMQSYYKQSRPNLKFTTVTCKIAASRSSALCLAHFADASRRVVGLFRVSVTETAMGTAQTKTLSVACRDSRTGKRVSCF